MAVILLSKAQATHLATAAIPPEHELVFNLIAWHC